MNPYREWEDKVAEAEARTAHEKICQCGCGYWDEGKLFWPHPKCGYWRCAAMVKGLAGDTRKPWKTP